MSTTTITQQSTTALFSKTVETRSVTVIPVLPTPSAATVHELLAQEFELRDQAISDGKAEKPESNSHTLSAFETKVEGAIKEGWLSASDQVKQRQEQIKLRLNEIRAEIRSFNPDVNQAHILDNIRALFAEQEVERSYRDFYRDCMEKKSAYQEFRARHQINHEASYPKSRLFKASLIFLIWFGESLANSLLFASGSNMGWIGGLAEAGGISLINTIFLAFLCGRFAWPYTNHVSRKRSISAFLAMGAFVIASIVFNLAVGHYRQALIAGFENAEQMAWQSFVAAPSALADLQAWILFFVGVGSFGLSSYEFYRLSDRYPGYEDVDRKYREADQRLNDKIRDIQNHAAGTLEAAIRSADDYVSKYSKWISDFGRTSLELASLAAALKSDAETLDTALGSLIKDYRKLNASVRTTSHPPYWQEDLPLRSMLSGAEAAIEAAKVTQGELEREAEGFRNAQEAIRSNLSTIRSTLRQAGASEIQAGLQRMKDGLSTLWQKKFEAPI